MGGTATVAVVDAELETVRTWFDGWYIWETEGGRWHARRRDEYFQQEHRAGAPVYAVHANDLATLVVYLTVQSGAVPQDLMWECELPRAEAKWLASKCGPLGGGTGGFIAWEGGSRITMDAAAFGALKHLGEVDYHRDGRITYRGEVPCVTFGRDMYPVWPVGSTA